MDRFCQRGGRQTDCNDVEDVSSPPHLSALRSDGRWTAVNWLKWSTNWIFIFSHEGIQVSEKRASRSGLVWLPFFPLLNPLLGPVRIFFYVTSRGLSPNLLCSTWKEAEYRSFGFLLSQIPSRSIHSVIPTSSPLHFTLSGKATVASGTPWCSKTLFTAAWRAI